ncbi:M48 family metalloprotease [Enterovibrio norvegicus]|uniref:M48 family metalloprotease n=1 Tax=Enterovibrio norvegicus TaxID=188144 RepID=UPI000C83F14D|nr:M48 family metalloprotease [Enterovibrio norvegicus]PMH62409.1 hypothetical protein BCU62_19620 [Enterovibrio norvegicus]
MKMHILPFALSTVLLSGCGLQTLTGSTYASFDGKFIEQETNTPVATDAAGNLTTDDKNTTALSNTSASEHNHQSLNKLRAASDKDLVHNPYAHRYLSSILNNILEAWDTPLDTPIYVSITTDRSYTASASKDTVMISLGVLADADSEDELAFVMAHELSHILLEHNDTNEYFNKQKALVSKAANVAMVTASLSDVSTTKKSGVLEVNLNTTSETQNQIGDIYKMGLTINRLSRDVISSSMTRLDEDEADLLAIDLITKAGYSPSVYKVVMQRLESSQTFNDEQLAEKKMEFQNFVSLASDANKNVTGLNKETLMYMAANEASTRLLQVFSERHNSPKERELDLAHYVKREYRLERRRPINSDAINKKLKKGHAANVSKNYWYASEALRAVEAGYLDEAEKLAKLAVRGKTKHHAYPRLAFYTVRAQQGQHKKALANLSLIKHWDYASIQTFNAAAQAYRQLGQPKKAEKILKTAEKSVGTTLPFYPEYIRTYNAMNKSALAQNTFAACSASSEENIVNQCNEAAGVTKEASKKKSSGGVLGVLDSVTTLIEL